MYAIVQTGGKQFRAEKDAVLIVEKIEGDPGSTVDLSDVVMVHDGKNVKVGSPYVPGAKVRTEIVRQGKAKKIHGFKYKAKK
ncbi:MAG: 50S ribosomal protein L21, partial [Armatimonadetes bacterium]|nr:50S ribosomal protein L21 [Armatimonadota bacterium]